MPELIAGSVKNDQKPNGKNTAKLAATQAVLLAGCFVPAVESVEDFEAYRIAA